MSFRPRRTLAGARADKDDPCRRVFTLHLRLPPWKRSLSFPVSARLYRKEADCDANHPFRTRQELMPL